MIFVEKALCDEMNIRIFVDADADVRLCRRIRRDVKKRGRSIDSVIDQYLTTVKPMHELYVEPSKKNANLIVPEGGKNLIALEMIINRIQHDAPAAEKTRLAQRKLGLPCGARSVLICFYLDEVGS